MLTKRNAASGNEIGLGRARARARSELGRFSMKAQLFREINGRFLPDELGDPFKFEEISLFNFEIFRLIHYYSQILGVSREPCRRSIYLLFHWFHFNGNFKTFYCTIVLLS